MLNIILKDLEMCRDLDKIALMNIIGSAGSTCGPRSPWVGIGTEIKGRTECIGTFLVDGELKQRYRCYYIKMAESYQDCDMSFCTSVCAPPC